MKTLKMRANNSQLEERIIALETRIAFQEHTIEELNKVVTQQRLELDDIILRVRELIKNATPSVIDARAETKPPHY